MFRLFALIFGAALMAPALAADPVLDRPMVLVAAPAVHDAAFRHTVLLVTPLPDGGHIGVIANRPTDVRLATLFPEHEPSRNVRDPVYFGGPMGGVLVALLDRQPSPGGKSLQMGDGVYLAVEEKVIDHIIEATPNEARYLVGVVEWEPGELNEQLREGVWQVADAKANTVIHGDTGHLWQDLSKAAPQAPDVASPSPRVEQPAPQPLIDGPMQGESPLRHISYGK